MAIKYYGRVAPGGYIGVVIVKDLCEAHVYNKKEKKFHRNDDFVKAAFDLSHYDEITKEKADAVIAKLEGK